MRLALIVVMVAVAGTVPSFAGADPVAQYPPPRGALVGALGPRWEVTSATSALEAHRASPQAPAPDFAARLDAAARELRQRGGGITVDLAKTSVHLAGTASDCDQVVSAAQRFAAIGGVNALVIDTTCRPRE